MLNVQWNTCSHGGKMTLLKIKVADARPSDLTCDSDENVSV